MNIIFFLFFLGIMFIIVGYTHQKTPSCDKGLKMKMCSFMVMFHIKKLVII